MNITIAAKLMELYAACPNCGCEVIGNEDALECDTAVGYFKRSCAAAGVSKSRRESWKKRWPKILRSCRRRNALIPILHGACITKALEEGEKPKNESRGNFEVCEDLCLW